MALSRIAAVSGVFWQSTQLHPLQKRSFAKQSQYNLRQRDFLQLQGLFFEVGYAMPWFPPAPDEDMVDGAGGGFSDRTIKTGLLGVS